MDCLSAENYCFSLPATHSVPILTPEVLQIVPPPSNLTNGLPLPQFDHEIGFRVLSAMMNAAVVSFCQKKEDDKKFLTDEVLVGQFLFSSHLLVRIDQFISRSLFSTCMFRVYTISSHDIVYE